MTTGLVLGKFMPLHLGHIALIEFALQRCDELLVLVCASDSEPIPGDKRLSWVEETFAGNNRVKPLLLNYDESLLPNTSVSSEEVSAIWAGYLKKHLPPIDIFFASEAYATYMGRFLGCDYVIFDELRQTVPVSSTLIQQSPFTYWDFVPKPVRPFYVKKICLYGTESTGKTTFTEKLARHFDTIGVTEMAREILEHTYECTPAHLSQIAELQARTINQKIKQANKLLFVDTDVNITRSYSKFLFDAELALPGWIEEANQFDLYLYMDIDAPYIQDGTRLSMADRDLLNTFHRQELVNRGIKFELLSGSWEAKFERAMELIEQIIIGGTGQI